MSSSELPFLNPGDLPEPPAELLHLRQAADQVKAEIRKILVGQDQLVELLLIAVLADGHALIEGVPGVAKTLSAKLLAKTMSLPFKRIQFTPDLMPSDVLGTSVFNTKTSDFEFRKGPVFAQVVLIDEINRAPAKTQAALFEVMEERQVTLDGQTYPMHLPFLVVATQNPIEQEGTYRLPEAQLDRFLFKIEVGYPSEQEETTMLAEFQQRKGVQELAAIQPVLGETEILTLQRYAAEVHVEPNLLAYIVKIVQKTRQDRDIYLGASPRASINLLRAAKAKAALSGRNFVVPEDIRFVAAPVLNHRILLTAEKEMEGGAPGDVIRKMVEQIELPR